MVNKFDRFLTRLRDQPEFEPILNPEEDEEPLTDPLAGIAWLAIKSGSYSSALFILNYLNEKGSESVYKFLKEKLEQPLVDGKNMYHSSAFSFAVYCDISFWYLSNQYLRMDTQTQKEAIVNEITTLANTTKLPMLIIDFLESIQHSLHQDQQIKKLTKDDIHLWTAPVLTSFPNLNRTILHQMFEPMLDKAHYEDLMRPIKENAATSIQRIGRQYLSTKQSSAVSIQRIIRGHLGVKRRKRRYLSIIRIQSLFRMKQHQTIYLDCINNRTQAIIKIQGIARTKLIYIKQKYQRKSATKIQAFLRMEKAKKTRIERRNAAIKLQSFQRMTTAKYSFKTNRNAATKIQAFQRMTTAKKTVNVQRDTIKKQNAAATKIQAFQRIKKAQQATSYNQLVNLISGMAHSKPWFTTHFFQNKGIVIKGVVKKDNEEVFIIDGTVDISRTIGRIHQFVIISILDQQRIQISWKLNHNKEYTQTYIYLEFLNLNNITSKEFQFSEPIFDGNQYTNVKEGIHLDQLREAAIRLKPHYFNEEVQGLNHKISSKSPIGS